MLFLWFLLEKNDSFFKHVLIKKKISECRLLQERDFKQFTGCLKLKLVYMEKISHEKYGNLRKLKMVHLFVYDQSTFF